MIALEELRKKLIYNQINGKFYWKKVSATNSYLVGKEAGCVDKQTNYIKIQVNHKLYYAHRLAWFYAHGFWPTELDHINRNRADNRLRNLREVSRSENQNNKNLARNNTSGYKGISWNQQEEKWHVSISKNKNRYWVGRFRHLDDALRARSAALEFYSRQ